MQHAFELRVPGPDLVEEDGIELVRRFHQMAQHVLLRRIEQALVEREGDGCELCHPALQVGRRQAGRDLDEVRQGGVRGHGAQIRPRVLGEDRFRRSVGGRVGVAGTYAGSRGQGQASGKQDRPFDARGSV